MGDERRNSQLTGVAGVHFVTSRLNFLGYHAVPTSRNVQGPDVLVSNLKGSKSITIQVKTTNWSVRTRGRGDAKKPDHHEWDIGWSSATINDPHLFFALVDLRGFEELPYVFLVPSRIIFRYFKGGDPKSWRRARYHPSVRTMQRYRDNWDMLAEALDD